MLVQPNAHCRLSYALVTETTKFGQFLRNYAKVVGMVTG